jgi:hypothetical protein
MLSRWKGFLGACFLAALAGRVVGACVFEPGGVGGPCTNDIDCPDDGVPCTKEVCTADGFCDRTPQDLPFGDMGCDDGNPCTDEVCSEGACAYEPSISSPNDGNECTYDACVDGVAVYTPAADGTACGLGGSLVCAGGKCQCTSALECGTSTQCVTYECINEGCASTIKEQGAFVDGNAPGDCLKNVCDGANSVVTVPDLTDPPADPAAGDCKAKACDDQGNVLDTDDPADVPASDQNVCTTEGCNGGTPVLSEPVQDGTECAGETACGPVAGGGYETAQHDVCVAGTCTAQPPVSCGLYGCDQGATGCLGTCTGDMQCVTGAYCDMGTNACQPVAGLGNPCSTAAQCGGLDCVDGVCCATTCNGLCERCNAPGSLGLCVPVPSGQDPASECAGADACDGAGDCAKPQGTPCADGSECLSGVCEDVTCCNTACPGACMACALPGSIGTCAPVPSGVQVTGCDGTSACNGGGLCKTLLGQPCGADGSCLSGFCQDGVCCNSACGGNCARCDLAGSMGTCTNVPSGVQVAGCNTNQACDGNNACKSVNGQTCTASTQCVSGFCPSEDGATRFCCNAACGGTCESCNGSNTVGGISGTCDFIKFKTDPGDECAGDCNMQNGKSCCSGTGMCVPP